MQPCEKSQELVYHPLPHLDLLFHKDTLFLIEEQPLMGHHSEHRNRMFMANKETKQPNPPVSVRQPS